MDIWLQEYGVSHQNPVNKTIHWICVPVIVFSLLGMLWSATPAALLSVSPWLNFATLFVSVTLVFYLRLSVMIATGFVMVAAIMLAGNYTLLNMLGSKAQLFIFSVVLFVVAWIGQFIGHKIEGAKPSFFKDMQFLLVGPAWLLHFIYKKLGISY